jgi:hypothetical protein
VKDFAFKVNLVALVRVQAADKSVARQVIPTVLEARQRRNPAGQPKQSWDWP